MCSVSDSPSWGPFSHADTFLMLMSRSPPVNYSSLWFSRKISFPEHHISSHNGNIWKRSLVLHFLVDSAVGRIVWPFARVQKFLQQEKSKINELDSKSIWLQFVSVRCWVTGYPDCRGVILLIFVHTLLSTCACNIKGFLCHGTASPPWVCGDCDTTFWKRWDEE